MPIPHPRRACPGHRIVTNPDRANRPGRERAGAERAHEHRPPSIADTSRRSQPPRAPAIAASAVRLRTPSFTRTFETWPLTVSAPIMSSGADLSVRHAGDEQLDHLELGARQRAPHPVDVAEIRTDVAARAVAERSGCREGVGCG